MVLLAFEADSRPAADLKAFLRHKGWHLAMPDGTDIITQSGGTHSTGGGGGDSNPALVNDDDFGSSGAASLVRLPSCEAQLRASSERGLKEEAGYLKMLESAFGTTTTAALVEVGADGLTDEQWLAQIKATKTKNLKAFYAAALAVLFAYAVLGMFLLPSSPFLPLLTAAVIILVDALVFSLVALGLYINPPVVVALLTGIRLALCSFGIRYWFLGHSIVYVLIFL